MRVSLTFFIFVNTSIGNIIFPTPQSEAYTIIFLDYTRQYRIRLRSMAIDASIHGSNSQPNDKPLVPLYVPPDEALFDSKCHVIYTIAL